MGRGRTCRSFRNVLPTAAFCLQRYFNFARNCCFRGCFMPRHRWGNKWVVKIIFISKCFVFLLCAAAQRREGSRAVLVLWSTPACPIGDCAAQSLATVFASYLFGHRFAGKRFSFPTGKTRRIGLFGSRIKHKGILFVHFSTYIEGAHSLHCFICNNYSSFNNLLKIKRLGIGVIRFCNY